MIVLKNISKIYASNSSKVEALKEVNLEIKEGEICGIIGFSGAGKSTLVRCINLLEVPTSGEVFVDNKELTSLSSKDLREVRKNIGMIFQHFNLMKSKTVFKNIAYPLKGRGLTKQDIEKRVYELLDLVGLKDKANSYPNQLSGGQKQRVAIARALANNPKVLLCDEATSALDPQTSKSILSLLKDINQKLGITIVLITHDMSVVKEICDNVVVMENGKIVEQGELVQVVTKPKQQVTKDFISSIFKSSKVYELLEEDYFIKDIGKEEILAKIVFVGQSAGQAFMSKITKNFQIDVSILFGNIEIVKNTPVGYLVVKFSGNTNNIIGVAQYLKENNIELEVLGNGSILNKNNTKCS